MNTNKQIQEYKGGCFCGYIRYQIVGKPIEITHCHCTICRRVSGAPFITWVTFASADFSFAAGNIPSRFNSSCTAERTFCNRCGTALTFAETERSQLLDVTVGSMDHPNEFVPEEHIWVSSRLRWLHINDGLPEYPQNNRDVLSTLTASSIA
jgi:hypothetical protein